MLPCEPTLSGEHNMPPSANVGRGKCWGQNVITKESIRRTGEPLPAGYAANEVSDSAKTAGLFGPFICPQHLTSPKADTATQEAVTSGAFCGVQLSWWPSAVGSPKPDTYFLGGCAHHVDKF